MTRPEEQRPEENGLHRRLEEDLGRIYGASVTVPEAVDASIRAHGRRHLAARRRSRLVLRWVAAAAAVLLATAVLADVFHLNRPAPEAKQRPRVLAEDVDGNGRINVLDAFALARRLEAGAVKDRRFDVTGDGRVDEADVDWIARRAVRLN